MTFQSSPFDKLRAGSAGLSVAPANPGLASWTKFSRPFGTSGFAQNDARKAR